MVIIITMMSTRLIPSGIESPGGAIGTTGFFFIFLLVVCRIVMTTENEEYAMDTTTHSQAR